MDNIFTLNAAYITALAAIIAPTITALIHSVKEYRISKMTHTVNEQIKQIYDMSECYAKCQYGKEKTGYMQKFYLSTMKLIPLCRKRSSRRSLFLLANKVYHDGASPDTDILFQKCILILSKEF